MTRLAQKAHTHEHANVTWKTSKFLAHGVSSAVCKDTVPISNVEMQRYNRNNMGHALLRRSREESRETPGAESCT